MVIICILIIFLYAGLLAFVYFENRRFQKQQIKLHSEIVKEFNFISILIPFKNEQDQLFAILNSLYKQEYPISKFEVILMDDNSSDESTSVIEKFIADNKTLNFILVKRVSDDGGFKKAALSMGLEVAKGKYILQLDSDVIIPPKFISSYNTILNQKVFITGPVILNSNSFWSKLLNIEAWALMAFTAFGIIRKSPQMANAANMIWDRNILDGKPYLDVVKHEIKSGDDTFLMNAAYKYNPDGSSFNFSENAIALTQAPNSLMEFVNQRLRWASKWKSSENASQFIFPAMIWLFHLLCVLIPIVSILFGRYQFALLFYAIKALSEFLFLSATSNMFNQSIAIIPFLLLQVLYSYYVVLIGAFSQFVNYSWTKK